MGMSRPGGAALSELRDSAHHGLTLEESTLQAYAACLLARGYVSSKRHPGLFDLPLPTFR